MRIAVVAGLLALLEARPVAACSCIAGFSMPPLDAADVPVNLHVLIFESNYGEVELRSDAGEVVPIGTSGPAWPNVNRVSIDAPLAPSTSYALWANGGKILRFRTGTTATRSRPARSRSEQFAIQTIDPDDDGGSCRSRTPGRRRVTWCFHRMR